MVLFKLLRVKQYSKNAFVVAALLFSRSYLNLHLVAVTVATILVMCLAGSATYIVNDVVDLERDRAHPKKSKRPIASGAVSVNAALGIAALCLVGSLALAFLIRPQVLECVVFYFMLQGFYNLRLKHVAIADVFVIATGFVLRVTIGAVAIHTQLSGWILLCTAALALLLGFGKRRSEFVQQGEERAKSRESLAGYSLHALDALVISSASGAIMCYGLYGIESPTARQNPGLILTIPFVAFGIFRYMMLIFGESDTGEPESVVFKDKQLALTFVLFIASAAAALSGLHFGIIN